MVVEKSRRASVDLEGDQLQLKQVRNLWAIFVIQKEIDRIPN